jgi:Lar family restriction alleviation protein
MSDDLKPCPFCTEGKSVSTYFDHEQGDKWGYASCDACGSRGPEVRTNYDRADDAPWRAEAIAAWNTRTPDPRAEALTVERDEHWKSFVHWRKEADALTEQLEAARADAKEAEGYAEELEKEIELNEQEACMLENDLIKADKEIDNLKVKLAKAVEGLNYCINAPFSGWTIAQGYARATLAEIESSEAVTLEGEKT